MSSSYLAVRVDVGDGGSEDGVSEGGHRLGELLPDGGRDLILGGEDIVKFDLRNRGTNLCNRDTINEKKASYLHLNIGNRRKPTNKNKKKGKISSLEVNKSSSSILGTQNEPKIEKIAHLLWCELCML